MACVPLARLAVEQAAVRALPLPARASALQPAIATPFARNATVPVGAVPVTVAVNVTVEPATDGSAELTSTVVVGTGDAPGATTCTVAALPVADRTLNVKP